MCVCGVGVGELETWTYTYNVIFYFIGWLYCLFLHVCGFKVNDEIKGTYQTRPKCTRIAVKRLCFYRGLKLSIVPLLYFMILQYCSLARCVVKLSTYFLHCLRYQEKDNGSLWLYFKIQVFSFPLRALVFILQNIAILQLTYNALTILPQCLKWYRKIRNCVHFLHS